MTEKQIAGYLHVREFVRSKHVWRAISLAPCHNQHATYTAITHSSRRADKLHVATGETTHVLFYHTLQRMAAQRATCRAAWNDKVKQHDKSLNLEFESFDWQEIWSWDTGKLTKWMADTENRHNPVAGMWITNRPRKYYFIYIRMQIHAHRRHNGLRNHCAVTCCK